MPSMITAAERTTRASIFDMSLPPMGSMIIIARFKIEKYSVNDALGTPK